MSTTMNCPECESSVELTDGTIQGEIVPCGECGVELEVLNVDPFELGLAPEEEEDWGE